MTPLCPKGTKIVPSFSYISHGLPSTEICCITLGFLILDMSTIVILWPMLSETNNLFPITFGIPLTLYSDSTTLLAANVSLVTLVGS